MSNNNIKLNAVEFKPTAFTPLEYTPVAKDISILNTAMEKREAYLNKASEDLSKIMTAANQMRTSLNSADHKWFDKKIINAENEINNLISRGDYHAAINRSKAIANRFYDAETTGRIKNNLQFEEWKKSVKEDKTLNKKDRDYYLNTVEYKYEPIKDNSGRIVGVNDWTPSKTPVTSMDYTNLIVNGAKFKTPDRTNQQGGGNILRDEKGNIVYDSEGKPTLGTSKSWHNERETLTKDAIIQTACNIAKQSDPSLSGVLQDIESTKWQLSQYNKKLKGLDENSAEYISIQQQQREDKALIEHINNLAANGATREVILDEVLKFRLTQTAFAKDLSYDYKTNSYTESITNDRSSGGSANEDKPDVFLIELLNGKQRVNLKGASGGLFVKKPTPPPETNKSFSTKSSTKSGS